MILRLPGRRDLSVSRKTFRTLVPSWHTRAYGDVQGESGGINIELRLYSIRLILNGALWAFRGIDRPQSGNHTESETRSRDFPWVPSPTNDPAAATWMVVHLCGLCRAYFDIMERHGGSANIFNKLYRDFTIEYNVMYKRIERNICRMRMQLVFNLYATSMLF